MARGLNDANWITAADADALAELLCEAICLQLRASLASQDKATLVVSGGSTPLPVFLRLSQQSLDWARIVVTLADERWVPVSDADSNERMVREKLLSGAARQATFISLYRAGETPEAAIAAIDRSIGQLPGPISAVILGMGADGHTASLFPQTPGLEAAMDLDTPDCAVIQRPTAVPQTRITLTRKVLLSAQRCFLHITGEPKRTVLEAALQVQSGPGRIAQPRAKSLPIAGFFEQHNGAMSVYWSP